MTGIVKLKTINSVEADSVTVVVFRANAHGKDMNQSILPSADWAFVKQPI